MEERHFFDIQKCPFIVKISIFTIFFIYKGGIFVKSTKTRKMVMIAILSALGMILNLIEIPYPFAPWLNFDLSEIVVLSAVSTMGVVPAVFVWVNYAVNMFLTMLTFAFIMYIINYLFVTPTYLMNKPTWYTQLPFNVDIMAFNSQYGSNIAIPSILNFLSPYAQAIFIIYFPFNFLKGIICAVVYSFVRPIEKNYTLE